MVHFFPQSNNVETSFEICILVHIDKENDTVVKAMREFIPREIHQTHAGSWSVVIGIGLGQARCIKRDTPTHVT